MLRKLTFFLSICALISGISTYIALTSSATLAEKTSKVLPFVILDFILLSLLAVVITKRLVELWQHRKQGKRGAKLHVHIVVLFSLITVTPIVILALFSPLFFNVGLQSWFGQPVRNTLDEAREVANAYLKEHQRAIMIDAQAIVNNLRSHVSLLTQDPQQFSEILNDASEERGLSEMLVFNESGNVLARSYLTYALELEKILKSDITKARNGGIAIRTTGDRVRALIRLDPVSNTYLFIGKLVDRSVLAHVSRTESAIEEYKQLRSQHSGAQITFIAFFSLVALLLLLSSVWIAINLSNTLVQPIRRLVAAAEDVSGGKLNVQVEETYLNNELDDLVKSFNRMTRRLQQQNHDLIISQRAAAWADVARKIAHEIKNPLTPIQLSAERLKRKYLKEIQSDPQTFQTCVDTIVRQVMHIGNLVNEFSSFARMPEPKLVKVNIYDLCKQVIFLEKQAHPNIEIILKTTQEDLLWMFDEQQLSQALTNLVQNAINAIEENTKEFNNKVQVSILKNDGDLTISCEDSGPGFPKIGRDKLVEPYYTTREKGTGLGLAIVSKIISDHNGRIELGDSEELGGAQVNLIFTNKVDVHVV